MTQLEFTETMEFLNPSIKTNNSFNLYDIEYKYIDNKVVLNGNIPRNIIQDIVLTHPNFNTFLYQLNPKDAQKQFINSLEVNDLDELIVVSLFMDDYYLLSKTGLKGNSHESYEDVVTEITRTLINRLNLTLTLDEWIRRNPTCSELYFDTHVRLDKKPMFKTSKKMYDYEYTKNIKRNVDNFDLSINPFMDEENNFRDLKEVLNKVKISLDDLDKGCVRLKITDKTNKTELLHERKNDGYYNSITYKNGEDESISYIHEFTASLNRTEKDGEKITIIKEANSEIVGYISYNLTTNKIKYENKSEKEATIEDKTKIYNETITANAIAVQLVDDYMLKKKTYKK